MAYKGLIECRHLKLGDLVIRTFGEHNRMRKGDIGTVAYLSLTGVGLTEWCAKGRDISLSLHSYKYLKVFNPKEDVLQKINEEIWQEVKN